MNIQWLWRLCLALSCWAWGAQVWGAQQLQVDLAYWVDVSESADLRQARLADLTDVVGSESSLNLGYQQHPVWVRVRWGAQHSSEHEWILEIPYYGLDEVDIHLPHDAAIRMGNARPRAPEQLEHRFIAVPIRQEEGQNVLWLRLRSSSALTLPLAFWKPSDFFQHAQRTMAVQALYFGAFTAMVLYNAFLAISLGDRRFWRYVLFALTLGMGMLSGNGYARLYLWPDSPRFDSVAQTFFFSVAGAFSIGFSRIFLRVRDDMPRVDALMKCGEGALMVLGLAMLAGPDGPVPAVWVQQAISVVVFPIGLMIFWTGAVRLRQGTRGVRYFMLAWGTLWVGVFVATARMFGWVPSNTWTMYALQISSVVEMLLLSFALADIVLEERRERDRVQRDNLALQENLVAHLRQSEEALEKAVLERTQALEASLMRQKDMLDQQIRLGALISHEFRNPIGIIQSQISLWRKTVWPPPMQSSLDKGLDIIASANRRLQQLFDRWLQGDRLQHLEDELELEDLEPASWLRDLIHAHPAYQSSHGIELDIQAVQPCVIRVDSSLLEIAMLNLIDNACKYSPPQTRVQVCLSCDGRRLGLSVRDQGVGIAASQQQVIFDDYVRLAPEGNVRGVGLGLAFVKRIANLLGAQIEVNSAPGLGSTFCLWFPAVAR